MADGGDIFIGGAPSDENPGMETISSIVDPKSLQPQVVREEVELVDNATLAEDDMMQVIVAAVNNEGLVGHNIKAFNELLDEGIPQILTELFDVTNVVKDQRDQTDMDRVRESIKINFQFHDVEIGRPTYALWPHGQIVPLVPNESRKTGRTYAAPLSLAATVTLTAYYADGREETKRAEVPQFQVAPIPIMVGCGKCHTWNLTRESRKGIEEDPNETGGYFLAKGGEWVVDWLENISFNQLHVHKKMLANENVRGEFISQPGGAFENSSQIIIRYMLNGALTIEINSTKFSKVRIPFYLIFRILGMSSDAKILEQIVYDPSSDSPVVRRMTDIIERAMKFKDPTYDQVQNELDREKLTEFMAARLSKFITNPTAYKSDEHAIQYLNDNLLGILDRALLPHIGTDVASRGLKLRNLGMLVHKTLLVDIGVLEPTDRDSYRHKRVHGAGISIAKAFKTQFNKSVSTPVMKALKREIRTTPFEELSIPNIVDAFKNPMASSDLGRTLEQAITSGNKHILVRRQAVVNRVSTQALERKNGANYISALRSVSTHNASNASKQTERADKMRRVHPSYAGYICVAKSADTGEMVGMKKELAITATVCSAGETLPLVLRMLEDPAIVPADKVATRDISRKNLACIFVNGKWIGCCERAYELVERYRILRREGRVVEPRTTIVWNPVTDDVEFYLDVGRVTRPLLIVDNNIDEYDKGCRAAHAAVQAGKPAAEADKLRVPFVQNIRLTTAHIKGIRAGVLTLEDLRAEGVVEWITPEEAENCYIVPSLSELRANANCKTARYTHCDVEQAIFGLTALISPYANHTQPARVTYETNQARQTGGWFNMAYPFRVDKNRFFQHYCETPLVRTISHNWLLPNGQNTIVAYMIDGGDNQEDSAIFKEAFVQRGGFAGAFFRFEKTELEKGETFGSPDITVTKNLKPNASYEKLVDGFVRPGTVVRKGDVIIGKVAKIVSGGRRGADSAAAADDGYKFIDRSIVYHMAEPATVVGVYDDIRGPNDNAFGLVKLRYHRPLGVGDKLSSRAGNKSITATLRADSDLPYDEYGITPDITVNPHSIPSRMTIGQMVEAFQGLGCQERGALVDGTAFRVVSIEEIEKEMLALGLRYNGLSRLYNGRTGEHFDAAIFMAPTYHQRLQKFVKDDEYAVGGYGPTNALTGQPLDGKNARGGLRVGEMEAWVLESHGAMMTMTEKLFIDSDGMEAFLCRSCGLPAIHNAKQGIYRCTTCGDGADIGSIDSCRASNVFQQEMRSANVKLVLGTRPREFEEQQ